MTENEDRPPLPSRRPGAVRPVDSEGPQPEMRYGRTFLGLGTNVFQAIVVMFSMVVGVPIAMLSGLPCLFALALSMGVGIILSGAVVMVYRMVSNRRNGRQRE